MKSLKPILLLSLATVLCGCVTERPSSDAKAEPSETSYAKPYPFGVFYLTNASPGVIRLATQVSSTYNLPEPKAQAGNPVCCVWLEVKPWSSKPNMPYYSVTVLTGGETFIYASSEDLLEQAVNRLKDSARSQSGELVVPVGKFSYFGK
jgi:hypothetical protein